MNTRKRVYFDRPIVNAQGLLGGDNYPPIRSDLPVGYTPLPNLSSESIAIQELKTRMDLDDIQDQQLADADIIFGDTLEELETQIDTVADQAAQDLQDHADQKANQAHG